MAPPHTISPAKSPIEIDDNMIEIGDDGTFGIDTEYVLSSGIDVESELQVDEGNDNSEVEDDDLEGCNLEDD